MLSTETVATQMWAYGYAMGQNDLTKKVLHKNMPIVRSEHNCGMMIPDLTPPMPGNLWYTVMWPFSSREIAFPASKVKMEGTPTGCAFGPVLPMMTCGEPVSAPTAFVHPIQLLNNVYVGMTLGDFLKGIAMIALEMVVDLVLEYGFKLEALKKWGKGFVRTAEEAGEKATRQVAGEIVEGLAKGKVTAKTTADRIAEGLMAKMGLSRSAAKHKALDSVCQGGVSYLTDDNPTATYGLGAPTANGSVGLSEEEGFFAEGSYMGQEEALGKNSGEEASSGESASSGSWGEALP